MAAMYYPDIMLDVVHCARFILYLI